MTQHDVPYLLDPAKKLNRISLSNLMTEQQAADYLTVSREAMSSWRKHSNGPSFIQLGPGRIVYRAEDIAAFLYARYVKTSGRLPRN